MLGIRASILLAVLPVFVALGVTSGFIEHYLVRHELIWGLRERAENIAVGVAAFLDRSPDDKNGALYRERSGKAAQLKSLPGVQSIAIIGSEDNLLEPAVKAALLRGETYLTEINPPDRAAAIRAVAPIRDAAGKTVAAAAVEIDASGMAAQLAALYNSLILRVVILSALALPVGWVFGSLLARRVEISGRRAREILNDPSPKQYARTRVRELDDVNETIEILAALLDERRAYSQDESEAALVTGAARAAGERQKSSLVTGAES